MGCGCNSINNTCGETHYASCTRYEGSIPEFTHMLESNCKTVEEVLADMYLIMGQIHSEIDLTELLTNGIDYVVEDGKITVKNAIIKHSELIIDLRDRVTSIETGESSNYNITNWDLDYQCLADSCDNPPTTIKELLQLIINQICVS